MPKHPQQDLLDAIEGKPPRQGKKRSADAANREVKPGYKPRAAVIEAAGTRIIQAHAHDLVSRTATKATMFQNLVRLRAAARGQRRGEWATWDPMFLQGAPTVKNSILRRRGALPALPQRDTRTHRAQAKNARRWLNNQQGV